jgi:tetratricopeptide (TPR) repeat protein
MAGMKAVAQKRYDEAEKIFERSYAFETQLDLPLQQGESLINLANVLYLKMDFQKAMEKLNTAQDLFSRCRRPGGVFRALQLKGQICYEQGQYDEALKLFEQCIRLKREPSQNGEAYFQAAAVLIKLQSYPRALDYLKWATLEFEKTGNEVPIIECRRLQALAQKRLQKTPSAKAKSRTSRRPSRS